MPTFHKGTGLMRIKLVPNKVETRIWARIYAPVFVVDPLLVRIELAENVRQVGRPTYSVSVSDPWHEWPEVVRFVDGGHFEETVASRDKIGRVQKLANVGLSLSVVTEDISRYGDRRIHYAAFQVTREQPKRLFDETSVYFKVTILTQSGDDLTDTVVEHQSPLLGEGT
jgi:hypothetical protein